MGLFGGNHSNGGGPGPPDPVRAYLALAIQLGAPAYNGGDPRGCFEVYACTARMLLRLAKGADEDKARLRGALEHCATEVDVDQQAWILRNAFDAVLGDEAG